MKLISHPVTESKAIIKQKAIKSAFYIGNVFHKRLAPKIHQFNYPLYMMFLDLDEVNYLDKSYWWFSARRWAPLQFKVSDYFQGLMTVDHSRHHHNPGIDVKMAAITLANNLGADVTAINRVAMLAQLRCFGLYFSPVNFFFLYQDSSAKYLLAEVSNTPWNKKHCYLIDLEKPKSTEKTFHVSPFMDLNMRYHWTIKPPTESTHVSIENWRDNLLFTATFAAQRHAISAPSIRKVLFQWPVVTASIIKGIYWQALKLFLKGIRYVPYQLSVSEHPGGILHGEKKGASHERS